MSFGVTAAVVGGAAALGGAALSASASRKAAKAQGDAASQQAQMQYDIYQQQREDQAPWRGVGNNALNELAMRLGIGGFGGGGSSGMNPNLPLVGANLVDTSSGVPRPNEELYRSSPEYRKAWDDTLAAHHGVFGGGYRFDSDPGWIESQLNGRIGSVIDSQTQAARQSQESNPLYGSLLKSFSAQDFQTDPGYQFRIGEGQKQIESSAAARGGLLSGAAAKALTKYNQNFASNEYQNAYNRFNTNQTNTFNRLANLAGVGQQATNATQQAGQNYATGASNALQYGGAARASGYAGQANALSAGLGGLTSAISNIPYGQGSTYSNNPYGTYSAQTSPVQDYYAFQGSALA